MKKIFSIITVLLSFSLQGFAQQYINLYQDDVVIKQYSTEEIEGRFGASSQYCQALDIQNYTEYFIRKEQYEQLFAKYVNAKGNISGEEKVLLKKLFLSMFSKEQYDKAISYLGNSYINQLNS